MVYFKYRNEANNVKGGQEMNKHIKRYITVMIVWSAILEGFAVYFGAYDILRVPLSLCAVLIAIIASGVMILKAVGSIIEERH